jgi:hypothetical protein
MCRFRLHARRIAIARRAGGSGGANRITDVFSAAASNVVRHDSSDDHDNNFVDPES